MPVAGPADVNTTLELSVPRDIVIMLDKNPLAATETAYTAVTAARVLKTVRDPKGNEVNNNVTLLPVLGGVNLARAEVLNSRLLKRHKRGSQALTALSVPVCNRCHETWVREHTIPLRFVNEAA
jgi:ribosomal protein L32